MAGVAGLSKNSLFKASSAEDIKKALSLLGFNPETATFASDAIPVRYECSPVSTLHAAEARAASPEISPCHCAPPMSVVDILQRYASATVLMCGCTCAVAVLSLWLCHKPLLCFLCHKRLSLYIDTAVQL